MRDALDEQLDAYHQMLPEIKKKFKTPVWVLVAHRELIDTFLEFSQAAKYAIAKFPDEQVLIRHTSETVEVAPFVSIED